jgi:hypothetical protein
LNMKYFNYCAGLTMTNSRFQLFSVRARSHSGRLSVGIGSGSIK